MILDVALFSRHITIPVASLLQKFREKHELSEAELLVDQFDYRTALSRVGLNNWVNSTDRNSIEAWIHALKMRIGRFQNSGMGSRASVRRSIEQFGHYYSHYRPRQALDGNAPVVEV